MPRARRVRCKTSISNAGMLNIVTGATALSSVASGLASAVGGLSATDLLFSTPGGVLTPNAGTSVSIAASGAFSIDQNSRGAERSAAHRRGQPDDRVDRLAVLVDRQRDAGGGSTFVNNAGAGAVSAPNGRWLIYSGDPLNDTGGGLVYDFKQYGATYGVTAVAQATGNGVLYTVSPTVGLTGTVSKTYDGNTSVAPGSYSIGFTGLRSGCAHGHLFEPGLRRRECRHQQDGHRQRRGDHLGHQWRRHRLWLCVGNNGVRQYRHHRGACDHGDGRCAEPGLRRCQSDAELSRSAAAASSTTTACREAWPPAPRPRPGSAATASPRAVLPPAATMR